MQELSRLLDTGYEISLIKDTSGYVASVDHDTADYHHTAIADTPGGALWAASPLHAGDEPYPGTPETGALQNALQELNEEGLNLSDRIAELERDSGYLIRALADACATIRALSKTTVQCDPHEPQERRGAVVMRVLAAAVVLAAILAVIVIVTP